MAISKANFNSFNVTPTASKFITFNSSNNGLAADDVGGALKLISTQTASSSSTLSFTSGIDSTYKEYIFKIINAHPSSNNQRLAVNFSVDGGSFIFRGANMQENDTACDSFVAGYANTTSAINAVQFKFVSGNIDSGIIKMYGVS